MLAQRAQPLLESPQPGGEAVALGPVVGARLAQRRQLAAGLGRLSAGDGRFAGPFGLMGCSLGFQPGLESGQLAAGERRLGLRRLHLGEVAAAALGLGGEARSQVVVDEDGPLPLDAAEALPQDGFEAAGPGPETLQTGEALGVVVGAVGGEALLAVGRLGLQAVELGPQARLLRRSGLGPVAMPS